MFDLSAWQTRCGAIVHLFKHTPQCKYKYVGYFEIRNVRIRVFYTEEGNEFFGERGLDLMKRQLVGNDPPVRS